MQICYLCGRPIERAKASDDHALPKHLIRRKQPKVKGFDYAGVLPTHADCNNRFGPESYCSKALEILAILGDEDCVLKRQHRDNPTIVMMAINSDRLKGFTKRDLKFFKFIDVRDRETSEWSSPSFFSDKPKTDPTRDALFVSLAVLAKSAAALLVSRHLKRVPQHWRILAMPYSGVTDSVDFDSLLGDTKPFDIGVKVWLKPFESGDWFAIFRARNVIVFFLFAIAGSPEIWSGVLARFPDSERLLFEGPCLADLLGNRWARV
jgi:hypothetical protein